MRKIRNKFILIVAGGAGTRMQSETPKQFIELCGLPVLMHTIRVFFRYSSAMPITVVLPGAQLTRWEELCRKHRFDIPHQTMAGGDTRFYSVKNGLSTLPDEGLVAIHDGVRPFVSHATIAACFQTAERSGNAIPAIPVLDTVREIAETATRTVARQNLRLVQTPQTFDIAMLKKAYSQEYRAAFTDDATVLETAGHTIHLVEGTPENIKITTPLDLKIGETIMNYKL